MKCPYFLGYKQILIFTLLLHLNEHIIQYISCNWCEKKKDVICNVKINIPRLWQGTNILSKNWEFWPLSWHEGSICFLSSWNCFSYIQAGARAAEQWCNCFKKWCNVQAMHILTSKKGIIWFAVGICH